MRPSTNICCVHTTSISNSPNSSYRMYCSFKFWAGYVFSEGYTSSASSTLLDGGVCGLLLLRDSFFLSLVDKALHKLVFL
jgi:hypothetical protein